jgi:hypothetical protein
VGCGVLLEVSLEVLMVEGLVEVNFLVPIFVVILLLVEGLTVAHWVLHLLETLIIIIISNFFHFSFNIKLYFSLDNLEYIFNELIFF